MTKLSSLCFILIAGLTASSAMALELTERRVTVGTELSLSSARTIADKLFQLDARSDEPIYLFINTRRGYTPAAMVVVDAIGAVKSKVFGVVTAEAFGPGAIVAAFCDRLYMFPHAALLYQPLEYDSARVMKEKPPLPVESANSYLSRVHGQLSKKLKISKKEYISRTEKGWYLTATDAKRAKISTETVTAVNWIPLVTETVEIKSTTTSKQKTTVQEVR